MKIRLKGGHEQDLLTGWRKMLCYAQKSRICKFAKRKYNRRLRQHLKKDTEDRYE